MKSVKVCYGAAQYVSHARVAQLNRELIRSSCEVVKKIDDADIVVLHFEPHKFVSIYEKYPALRSKYVIGYCVWEANELPDCYKDSISYVREVWTCSRYCCDIFKRYHPRVAYIPHVIERDTSCSIADREYIRRIISFNPNILYYLFITKLWDRRKNTRGLAMSFLSQRSAMPNARLIIKASPQDVGEDSLEDGIIYLREHLTEGQMNALYDTADVYVSAHHSEGWGLTLSDAMVLQKPIIATGYSGNLEFMNAENSFLLDFTVNYIKHEDCFYLFQENMKWAYPSDDDLGKKLLFLYFNRDSPVVRAKIQKAAEDIKMFSRTSVERIVRRQISSIVNSEHFAS